MPIDTSTPSDKSTVCKATCPSCDVELGIAIKESARLAYRVATRSGIAGCWVVTVDAVNGAAHLPGGSNKCTLVAAPAGRGYEERPPARLQDTTR